MEEEKKQEAGVIPKEFICGKCQLTQDIEFEYFDVECCHVCYSCLKKQTQCPVCRRELEKEEIEMISIYNEVYYEEDPLPPDNVQV